jgi:cell division septum initiation protein DivIVA
MDPRTGARAGHVSGEAPPRPFNVVVRGYDRQQVDEYLKQSDLEIRQHREQVQALQQELTEAHRQLREKERPSYTGLGSRIEQLLHFAEEQATEIVGEARSAANELQAAAKFDATELRAGAENEAAEVRARAEQHSKQLVSNAKKNADQIVAQADQLMSDTKNELERHRAAWQREVDELTKQKDAITSHLDQLRGLLGGQMPPTGPPAKAAQPAASGGQSSSAAPAPSRSPLPNDHPSPPTAPGGPGSDDQTMRGSASASAAGLGIPAAGEE